MMKENFFQYVQTLSGSASTTLNLNKKILDQACLLPHHLFLKKKFPLHLKFFNVTIVRIRNV